MVVQGAQATVQEATGSMLVFCEWTALLQRQHDLTPASLQQ